ncbi:MAG: DsbA family protein [Myxococcales bacterium FL481]|nr:MAG: DsbA family protein [Myxococcales bacterium FL481]
MRTDFRRPPSSMHGRRDISRIDEAANCLIFTRAPAIVPNMRTISLGLVGTATLALTVCQRPAPSASDANANAEITDRLDKIEERLDKIEKGLKAVEKSAAKSKRPSRPRPDPKTVYSVPLGNSAYSGPEHAKVTIVEVFEYACPFCDRVRGTLKQLAKDYGDDLKIVYKNYVVHPQVATTPALAACAAGKQGKYSEMMELIWEKGFKAGRNLGAENMTKLAKETKLDMKAYESDMSGACKTELADDRKMLSAIGVRGTPAFFVNGRYLSGAQPIDRFKAIIDEELEKANKAVASGASVEAYYAENVVKKGKKKL